MRIMKKLIALTIAGIAIQASFADTTIINNNNNNSGQQPQQSCDNSSNNHDGIKPGTYNINHGDGTSETIYTTGDKQPYFGDNNCNQPAIQPYVQPIIPYGPHGPRR